ncbi:L-rhamnose mutarotase [Mucilaginibacter terrae]|uniref:L-rhamnose mutarotase n=1 Tax=Mucilaginibacter terrae TaxID=1955052 RepID=A0ABU3GX26_9SPHI|nr:L-rhamnose mutarotase [Mucilaginibacter terrae]MDT3404322.1 L-rhamnose mutarotase [Mucilaginibacter terrae]
MNKNNTKRYCLALDLVDDPKLIEEYERWHKAENCWPEINDSIRASGIIQMEIYRTGSRLFMIMETEHDFNFDDKARQDAANAVVQKWETMMSKYQQPLPWAKAGEKWTLMNLIYQLQPVEQHNVID